MDVYVNKLTQIQFMALPYFVIHEEQFIIIALLYVWLAPLVKALAAPTQVRS